MAISQERQNLAVPQPQLEQANQALVAQSGAQEYAPHVISTPLSFLIKSALNTNIFGEPGWQGTGWRAGRDLQRHDIGGKTGTTNSSKDARSQVMARALSPRSGLVLTITAALWGAQPLLARLKIRFPVMRVGLRVRNRRGMLT